MFQLTKANVIDKLAETVAAAIARGIDGYDRSGDHFGCTYRPSEKNPLGCLIGALFTQNGATIPPEFDYKANAGIEYILSELISLGVVKVDEADRDAVGFILGAAQRIQDVRGTWVGALDHARSVAGLLEKNGEKPCFS